MLVSVKDNAFTLTVLTSEDVLEAAANYLASLPREPDRYAIIFNGEVADRAEISHAIIAHAGERGGSHAYTVFQAYDSEMFSALGRPQNVGPTKQLFDRQT